MALTGLSHGLLNYNKVSINPIILFFKTTIGGLYIIYVPM